MSTDNTNPETAETETERTEDVDFGVSAIRSRLPSALTSKQQRAAICMVRNPDASLKSVAESTAVSSNTVLEALRALAFGATTGPNNVSEDLAALYKRRGGAKMAETYDGLSPKQKAVIDWLARREGTLSKLKDRSNDNLTGPMVADAVAQSGEYDVAVSNSYPIRVAQEYGHLVTERREQLALEGDLGDESEEVETVKGRRPREVLASAGVALPESNLDSLGLGEALTEQQRLDAAYERGQRDGKEPVTEEDREQYTAPYGCPECGHQAREDTCRKCGADKRYEWAKREDEADEEPETEDTTEASEDEADTTDAEADMSEELDQPLVDSPEALTDALNGLTERLEEHQRAIDTLRASTVTEEEVEAILNNFEERMKDALEAHRRSTMDHVEEEVLDEVFEEVDRRLQNSVKRSLMERVSELETYMEEHPADGGFEAEGRLGLLLADMEHYAGTGAYVTGMEVEDGSNVTTYSFTVHHGGKTPRKGRGNGGDGE